MSAQDDQDLGVAPEATRPDSCALDLKKYFYVIGVAAVLILGGTYWYTKFYSKGMGAMPMAGADAKSGATKSGAVKSVANWFPNLSGGGAAPAQPQPGAGMAMVQPQSQPGVGAGKSPAEFVLARANFPSVVAAVHDSVVHISATRGGSAAAAADPRANAPGIRFPSPFAGRTYESIGAGLIVQGDGYVVTNYHVVRGANAVGVVVAHGPMAGRYPAEVLKLDESVDLALLKIQPRGPLSAAMLGDSDDVRVADGVIAIGSPFGLEQTVSHGIVSAVRKSMVIEGVTHTNLIQTDAAINQGNSGGPLIAKNGAVIGINTAIYTPTGAFAGIGFAVPSNSVRMFLQGMGNVASPNAAAFARPVAMTSQGVGGQGVGAAGPTIVAGTPAPHADGREKMDCLMCHKIVAAAATPAPVAMQFQFAQPNTSLAMNVAAPRGKAPPINASARAPHRDGRETMDCKACHAIIGAAASTPVVFAAPAGAPSAGLAMNVAAVAPGKDPVLTGTGTAAMGAGFVLIDKALAARLNQPERQGVFVSRVAPNTAAAASGLNPGDIVLKIDGRRIRDPGQAVSTLAARKSGEVARLGILRNGKDTQVYLVVTDMTVAAGAGPAAGISPARTAQTAAAGGPNPGGNAAPPRRVPNDFNWMGLEVEAFSMVRPVGAPGAKPIQGAKVNEVKPGSAAEKAGVKIGDLLVEINRLPVADASQMDRAIRAANGQPGKLLKLMRGTEMFFAVLP